MPNPTPLPKQQHPQPQQQPKHSWSDPTYIHEQGKTDRRERTCTKCGLVRITMIPPHGLAWREWRHPKWEHSVKLGATPPCVEKAES